MISKFPTVVVAVFSGLIGAAPVNAMSLKEAVAVAVSDNPRIKAAQASRRATDQVLLQAKGRYFPEIEFVSDAGREIVDRPEAFGPFENKIWYTRRQAGISVKQVLFDGFDRSNDVYRSQSRISAASKKVLARSEAIALDVIEAYIDVIRHIRLIRLSEENVRRHRELLGFVRVRVAGGKNSEGDLVQTEERLQAALALTSEIKARKEVAAAKFKNAVGVGPSRLQRVRSAKQLYDSTSSAMSVAIANNPRLAALKHEIDVAGYTTDQSRSTLYPLVTLEGSASRGEDLDGTAGRSNDFRGVVVFRWKLFDGGVRSRRVEELTEREYVKISEYDSLVRDIGEEIEIAWTRIYEGRRQVEAKREQLRLTEKVVASYRLEYEANKRSILDVLNSENTRFSIEFDLSNATSISQFSSYQLLGHTGKLLDTLGVARPEGSDIAPNPSSSLSSTNLFNSFAIPKLRQD